MPKSAALWLDQLLDRDLATAHRARLKLGGLGPEDVRLIDGLLAALDSRRKVQRFWALVGVGCLARHVRLGVPAIERLLMIAANDPVFGHRQAALLALAKCRRDGRAIAPQIAAILANDSSWVVRAEAARSLGTLGRLARDAAPALVAALADSNRSVRSAASIALKFVPIGPRTAGPIRRLATEHADEGVRLQLQVSIRRSRRARRAVRPSARSGA